MGLSPTINKVKAKYKAKIIWYTQINKINTANILNYEVFLIVLLICQKKFKCVFSFYSKK
jgi:hypothetical protein